MKLFLTAVLVYLFSNSVLAAPAQPCNPGEARLKQAALSLSQNNNPDGELSAVAVSEESKGQFIVKMDDNYGYFEIQITAVQGANYCRIKSILEK